MKIEFETTIKEAKGAVNTAAKVADLLKNAEVIFTTCSVGNATGVPAIEVKLPGWKEAKFVAVLKTAATHDFFEVRKEYGVWWRNYAKRPSDGHGHEEHIFEYATNAATYLTKKWLESLCDEYTKRLEEDEPPK